MKITALVPMRHHSVRVPGKNFRIFAGKPLFFHIVQTLVNCPLIDGILIDTDSDVITKEINTHFPMVKVIERPINLRDDKIPMNEIIMHDINNSNDEFFLQTHSTSPLLKSSTIEAAINTFLSNYPQYDSLFSVTKHNARFWDSVTHPLNHNPQILMRTQDLPPLYEENSSFYIFSRETMEKYHNRIGMRPYMFPTDPIESWDIDEETDFIIAEQLMLTRGLKNEV